jgi:hypothetical protein
MIIIFCWAIHNPIKEVIKQNKESQRQCDIRVLKSHPKVAGRLAASLHDKGKHVRK